MKVLILLLREKRLILTLFFICAQITIGLSQDTPRAYVAHKAIDDFVIDGKADEVSWQEAIWSKMYIDIEGKKEPKYETKMKMVWDQENLYVFAQFSEPHVWANLKQRDTIIFYNNDFEIFIDPDGDTHNYYEFEMNALNTVWDLFLSKPYRNQGTVLGGWDFKGLESAVHVQGTLNDASDIDKGWSVEIAIPWSFTTDPGGTTRVPINEYWRMNFSRVNWEYELIGGKYYRKKDAATKKYLPEYNWVWSPQGVINMHEPEHWGYVYFSSEDVGSTTKFDIPEDEHIKWYLYKLFREYSKSMNEKVIEEKTILGHVILPKLSKYEYGWTISAKSPFTQKTLSIKEDGKFESIEMD